MVHNPTIVLFTHLQTKLTYCEQLYIQTVDVKLKNKMRHI